MSNETKNEPSAVRVPAPELTSQEWELRRKERVAKQWADRRARWAAYKKAQNYLRGA
jgi:hypothetical protein